MPSKILFSGDMLVVMKLILFNLVLMGLTRASQYEDFFHMPSSENPLGGGLRIPRLPLMSMNREEKEEKEDIILHKTPILPFFRKDKELSEVVIETASRASPYTPLLSVLSSLRGLTTKATTYTVKIVVPVIMTIKIIQHTLQEYEKRRDEIATSGENRSPEVSKRRKLADMLTNAMGKSSHKKLDKIQKDQEECWRVLHSVYKKHSSLEELMEKKLEESTNAILQAAESKNKTTDKIEERLTHIEKRFIELESLINSTQSSVHKELSSHATKKELEEMMGLMKSFVEQLKAAISNENIL